MSDVIPQSDFIGLPDFTLPKEAPTIVDVIINNKDVLDVNYENLKKIQNSEILSEEIKAIKHQLRRFVHFIITNEDAKSDIKIELVNHIENNEEVINKLKLNSQLNNCNYYIKTGNTMAYINAGNIYYKYSPMVYRLSSLCSE